MTTTRTDTPASDDDPRPEPPTTGADERTTLLAFLRWYRGTLELKCEGLSPGQLARRAAEPSTLSLLGLIRHLTDMERAWARRCIAGEDAPRIYSSPDDPDASFDGATGTPEVVAEAWDAWRAEAANTDRLILESPSLDIIGKRANAVMGEVSLRWALNHMTGEYARHLGHADLLRERIDGRVGQ